MNEAHNSQTPYHRYKMNRRRFLRGVGVAMALPWLESIPVWGDEPAAAGAAAGAASAFPKRFATLFHACGVVPDQWWARGNGTEMELSRSIEPMAPFKDKLNVFSGLFNRAATGVGIHPGQTGNLLSGASLTRGAELRGGISMDQVLANNIGQESIQPCIVLGCEQPITGYHETNFSMAYGSYLSWRSETSPVPMEVYPSLAWDSLFDNHGQQRNRSILDRVQEEAASLSRQISVADRARLDEYLSSVREVETRVAGARAVQQRATNQDQPVATMPRPENGLPEDIREHMRLMCDIISIGFQTDKTRVATLLLCRDISGLFYPFLNVRASHHPASHNQGEDYQRIVNYYVSQCAYLASRLQNMREGDATVLDHSCILYLSNMFSGSAHDSSKLPVFTVGGLGGTLQTGRTLDYSRHGDQNRKMCSLYLSILDRMGVHLDHFGDAESRLADL